MNKLLQISGRLLSQPNNNPGVPIPKFNPNAKVSIKDIEQLSNSLMSVLDATEIFKTIKGVLLSVEYREIVAKSNRLRYLFKLDYKDNLNDHIRGAKFKSKKHVFTYYFKQAAIYRAIENLDKTKKILSDLYQGTFSACKYKDLKVTYNSNIMSRSAFSQIMADLSYIQSCYIDSSFSFENEAAIISFYSTDVPIFDILTKFGIGKGHLNLVNNNTAFLSPEDLLIVRDNIPYLVSMSVKNLTDFVCEEIEKKPPITQMSIPDPNNEPVVGVIDTLFDQNVYFHKWVEYDERVDPNIASSEEKIKNLEHGTGISSIIVDGPRLNPTLEDECGRFRVKHFGVTIGSEYSSFNVIKEVENIIASNRDIKVWNFSLGSESGCNENFISPEAALLDKLQSEYDVVFIVSGTNFSDKFQTRKIGSPADSVNSIVVNSVKRNGEAASYSRNGPILSFYQKPDVSYYGGDVDEKIYAFGPLGVFKVAGTSYAAAWITRKVAFLIYQMGLSKEVAKALIIDSAYGWESELDKVTGFGVVPIKISSILETQNDEIRFLIQGVSREYETFAYDIPVPSLEDKHPFYARATLCYFPTCDRNQGVDYTNTELDIHFGRVGPKKKEAGVDSKNKESSVGIHSINSNRQGDLGTFFDLSEENVRQFFRKWDCVKTIREAIKTKAIGKKTYENGLWGISIKSKERLSTHKQNDIPFGVVITLKEINGKNRINEFIKLCSFRGWIVNEVDIKQRINVYNSASEEIIFD